MKGYRGNSPLDILRRYALYTILIVAVLLPLPSIVTAGGIAAYCEGGFIEWCQFFLLTASLIVFVAGVYIHPEARGTFAFLAILVCLALVRENDAFLDRVIPIWGWEALAAFVAVGGVLVVFRERSLFMQSMATIIAGHSFPLLWCGFVAVIPFAQLLGRAVFLKALLGIEYLRNYKTLVHESTELLGYVLIAIGAIEALREISHAKEEKGLVQTMSVDMIHGGWRSSQ